MLILASLWASPGAVGTTTASILNFSKLNQYIKFLSPIPAGIPVLTVDTDTETGFTHANTGNTETGKCLEYRF
jgi:hypothetical protein